MTGAVKFPAVTWLGYRRVSRVGGREHLISPELQEQVIRTFADGRGLAVEIMPPELDVSGGKRSRPILDQVIAEIKAGAAEGVIVSDLDRLSRMKLLDALQTIHEIEDAGGQVIAVKQNFDPTTPAGRLVRNTFLSINAMYREQKAEEIARSKQQAIKRGIWPGSVIPRGYIKDPKTRKLVPGPDAEKVVRAFEARAAGKSWRDVARVLGEGLGPSSCKRMISGRVYLGEIHVGEWSNLSAHEPIVSRALWERAQVSYPAPVKRGDGQWVLRGLVRCAGCQRTMSASEGAYRCLNRVGCPVVARVKIDVLDPVAVSTIRAYLGELRTRQAADVDHGRLQAEVEAAEAELAAYQRATSALADESLFVDGLRQRAEAVDAARRKLNRPRLVVPSVEEFDSRWSEWDVAERRHALSGLLGVVWVWSHTRWRFIARGFEPQGLSGPGRKAPEVLPVADADLHGEIRITGDLNVEDDTGDVS